MPPTPLRSPFLRLALALLLPATLLGASGCTPSDGFVADFLRYARETEYLHAVTGDLRPNSITNLLAHFERGQREPAADVAPAAVPENAWDGIFQKLWELRDTSDFDVLGLLNLIYAFGGHPAVPEALWQKTEQALLDFKYWYSDPTPERLVGGAQVIDNMWYWSENHILIFRTSEFLAGQLYPERVFSVTGLTGREHMERARPAILAWLEERARWGFTEWHSNVYYHWDLNPLLSLSEWSQDEEIARRARMVIDLVLLDIALHLHRGTFGATHGRSYPKDFPSADLEDTFQLSKLLFDDTVLPYRDPVRGGGVSLGAILLARSRSYRLPEVIRRIAIHEGAIVDRERMSLPIPEAPPANFDDPIPPPPYGLVYQDEAYLPVWWSMAAHTLWPILPLTLQVAERDNLWAGQFEDFEPLRNIVWVDDDFEATLRNTHGLYKRYWRAINQGALTEVNTYTHRTPHYMLSTAQDYRKGLRGMQTHTWQATLSEHAMVRTQHPMKLAISAGSPIPASYDWQRDEGGPGYWTGEASQPRSAQFENVGISIYAPQYATDFLFTYRSETHAYFPVAHFDEVVQEGGWTFGRKDDGYVALYSHQPAAWRTTQPDLFQNAGLPFDLVAPGAQNVWIVECGSAPQWGSFAAFRAAIAAASIVVTPIADQGADGMPDGFDVVYQSPSQGAVTFGWHAPFTVAGSEIPLSGYPRFDNPFLQVAFDDTRYEVSEGGFGLVLDFDTDLRQASAPPEEADRARQKFEAVWDAVARRFRGE